MLDVQTFTNLLADCYQRSWLIAAAILEDRVEADDVLQEAAMTAFGKRAEFAAGTNFAAWFGQIVRLTALNHRKKVGRRVLRVADARTLDRAHHDRGDDVPLTADGRLRDQQSDFDDRVLRALGELAEIQRACLLLRVVRQLNYAEISAALQIPEGTAMSHVHRAKQHLRQRLQTPPAGEPTLRQDISQP